MKEKLSCSKSMSGVWTPGKMQASKADLNDSRLFPRVTDRLSIR